MLFSVLPDELMVNILFYLPVKEILRLDCAMTNKLYRKHWNKILHNSISPNYYCQEIYLMKDYDITGVVVLKNDYVVVSTSNDIILLNLKEFTHQAIVRDYEESFEGIYTFPDDDNLLLSISELGMVTTTWNITTREIVCLAMFTHRAVVGSSSDVEESISQAPLVDGTVGQECARKKWSKG